MLMLQKVDYFDDTVLLEGFSAYDNKARAKLPAVLIAHDWSGKNAFACQKAEKLAELGYFAFAIDMYGKGKIGHTKEEKIALMEPLLNNRTLLQKRMLAAFNFVKTLDPVDPKHIFVIGFCFGGLCALDLARTGANVSGVVSFHGLLDAPLDSSPQSISAKILALHGYDDPMVTPEQVLAFSEEMTRAKADWQMHIFGNTMHAFTNPDANDPSFGTVYSQLADSRAWQLMKNFFQELNLS
jgi:dienelactone hydrolase